LHFAGLPWDFMLLRRQKLKKCKIWRKKIGSPLLLCTEFLFSPRNILREFKNSKKYFCSTTFLPKNLLTPKMSILQFYSRITFLTCIFYYKILISFEPQFKTLFPFSITQDRLNNKKKLTFGPKQSKKNPKNKKNKRNFLKPLIANVLIYPSLNNQFCSKTVENYLDFVNGKYLNNQKWRKSLFYSV